MTGQRIGYVRVSSLDQQVARQLEGIALDRTFTDTASGKDTRRPQLEFLLSFARAGDTVVVHSMDRLARNLDDLRRIVHALTGKGVRIEFVKEHLAFTGEDSPMASLMLSVMGAFAEFERALIRERQREGIALAKQRGVYRGRKKALSQAAVAQLRSRIAEGISKAKVAREFGISRQTLYQYLQGGDGAPHHECAPQPGRSEPSETGRGSLGRCRPGLGGVRSGAHLALTPDPGVPGLRRAAVPSPGWPARTASRSRCRR